MASLNHFKDLFDKKGKEFIKSLFDRYVIILEKIDGCRFEFQKINDHNNFLFYKNNELFFKRNVFLILGIKE